MPQLICVVSQRSAVAIRRLDDDALAGNFGGVDWRGLGAIAEGIATALGKTQVLARSEIEMVQTLHPDGATSLLLPSVFMYHSGSPLSEADLTAVERVCATYSERITFRNPDCGATGDLYADDRPEPMLSVEQEQAVDEAVLETLTTLRSRLPHAVVIEGADRRPIAQVEGKLRSMETGLVGEAITRDVHAVIDGLSYRTYAAKLLSSDGEVISANYESHHDLDILVDLLRSQRDHIFQVVETMSDKGKPIFTIRSTSLGSTY